MSFSIEQINAFSQPEFVDALGWVYEHSPWVAERSWKDRPFHTMLHLCDRMNAVLAAATHDEQLALLRAHPDLGTRARISPSSTSEQTGAGLDHLTAGEHATLLDLNNAYKEKFGFPFLFAVKGSGKVEILDALEHRLQSTPEAEFKEALSQVFRIARFRLENAVTQNATQ
jgi:2-oxo-4-hydroxy-4-carboxy-5-ureidoimidazoline decarboxylase